MKKITLALLILSGSLNAAELQHNFNSPAFSGIGYSNHVLTIQQMEQQNVEKNKALADALAAKAAAQQKLIELQQQGQLAELQADSVEAQELTKRAQADMSSDSWLSKNIRPLTLIAILTGYFVFAMMSAYGMNTNENYVQLLGQWGMLIMSFYFGGRTMEKLADKVKK